MVVGPSGLRSGWASLGRSFVRQQLWSGFEGNGSCLVRQGTRRAKAAHATKAGIFDRKDDLNGHNHHNFSKRNDFTPTTRQIRDSR